MNKYLLILFLAITWTTVQAQCPADLNSGQNLIVNGDFSQDYTGWTFTPDSDGDLNTGPDGYKIFTSGFSVPGYIFVGTGSQMPSFNNAFSATFNDHSPSSDDKFLMIDGVCVTGIKLWRQTNIPVQPNTNYYFSVWINSLKDNPNYPGIVNFDVNGQNIGANIIAPKLGGANPSSAGWQKYETVWNSGSNPPATVTISIEGNQTVGCGGTSGESDFAIDDIAFIPGCAYGSTGPQPDLGPDRTLCGNGGSGITLDAGVPQNSTTIVTWVDSDGNVTSGTGLSAPYTFSATKPGTYSVCVSDNGSCTKSDAIVVNNTFSVNLGSDVELCNPAATTLDAGFTGVGVTYKWYKNYPTEAPGDNTQKTYYVNTPGTYKVEVTDPLCGMQSSQITITTKAPVATNAVYCNPGNITLSVSPNNSGKYKWWTSPTSTALTDMIQKGSDSYTFAATPTNNYIFYVEDTASFRIPVGLPLTGNGLTNPQNRSVQAENELKFDVQTAIVIDSVYIDLHTYGCPSQTIQLQVTDASGNIVGTSPSWAATTADGCVVANSVVFKMPVGIAVPVGTGYKIRMSSGSNMNWYQTGMTYPQNYNGVITFTGNSTSGWANNAIPGMYRWIVTAGNACARVPVTATYKSCAPPPPLPTAHAGSDIVLCNTHTTQLNASLDSGETGVWTFAVGSTGTVSPANSTTATVTFTGDTARMVWNVTNVTGTSTDTVIVSTTMVQKPAITGPGSQCPGTTSLLFTANPDNTANGSTYEWSVVSGDITMVSGENTFQLTADGRQTQSVVKLKETNNNCSAENTDTLKLSPLNTVAFAGADINTCNTSVVLTGNTPSYGTGSWSLVTPAPSVTLTVQSNIAVLVNNLTAGESYDFKYEIAGACGAPSSATVTVTVGAGGFAISTIDQPEDTLCVGSTINFTVHVTSASSGSYNYIWSKKGVPSFTETASPSYSIVTSDIKEVYYVYVQDKTTNCNTDLDSVEVASINYQHLYVPNLITPNGDNKNDELKITEVENTKRLMVAKNSELVIYNTWGKEVFRASNYNNDWNAHNVPDGVYYYYLKAGCGGEEHKSWLQILGNVYK
ncbi:MAG: gliding motility-associated C-terminal domain-containing protein [Cytophaga sp.]|uniref:gliding motility-associated C-terminal domain-containing protein n=1 Tax=Cytophaga sp. TaxID=29535 RepID=UPI003F808800